jgi:hypothetical protein
VPGRNLYGLNEALAKTAAAARPCIFISYTSDDRSAANEVADLCTSLDVNVWLDTRDISVLRANETGDKKQLVDAIDKGLAHSTHLLGVLGPTTFRSWWVPYEIGAARGNRKEAAHLTLANVSEVPDYVAVSPLLQDELQLRAWLTRLAPAELQKSHALVERMTKLGMRRPFSAHLPLERKGAVRVTRS